MTTSDALASYAMTCFKSQISISSIKSNVILCLLLAAIPPVAKSHFEKADELCNQPYERRKNGEEEEILTYRTIITNG